METREVVKLLGPLPGNLQLFTITNLRQSTATATAKERECVYFGFRKPSVMNVKFWKLYFTER